MQLACECSLFFACHLRLGSPLSDAAHIREKSGNITALSNERNGPTIRVIVPKPLPTSLVQMSCASPNFK